MDRPFLIGMSVINHFWPSSTMSHTLNPILPISAVWLQLFQPAAKIVGLPRLTTLTSLGPFPLGPRLPSLSLDQWHLGNLGSHNHCKAICKSLFSVTHTLVVGVGFPLEIRRSSRFPVSYFANSTRIIFCSLLTETLCPQNKQRQVRNKNQVFYLFISCIWSIPR